MTCETMGRLIEEKIVKILHHNQGFPILFGIKNAALAFRKPDVLKR